MIAALTDAVPSIEQLANYGVAGLLAFVCMFAINRLAPGKSASPSFSQEDRRLLEEIASNSAETNQILNRLQVVVDTWMLQHR